MTDNNEILRLIRKWYKEENIDNDEWEEVMQYYRLQNDLNSFHSHTFLFVEVGYNSNFVCAEKIIIQGLD